MPAIAHPQLYMRPMNESDLSAARALLSPGGQTVACMLPIAPELASSDDLASAAARSWDALASETPRNGLFVVRRKGEHAAMRPAANGAGAETTTQAGAQNALGDDREEGPVVGVVSLRYNTNFDGSCSGADIADTLSGPMVHTMDCLVCSACLSGK